MAYFSDLSFYRYSRDDNREAKNVGWLQQDRKFDRIEPSEETLGLLWSFCTISVMQSRGGHFCDLCEPPHRGWATRNGITLHLGTAEIRVFSKMNEALALQQQLRKTDSSALILLRASAVPHSVYAAPTLIYHYVSVHHYKPPGEFLHALREGPRPPSQEYFERLKEIDLEWRSTGSSPAKPDPS
jgi:hypothetical protein